MTVKMPARLSLAACWVLALTACTADEGAVVLPERTTAFVDSAAREVCVAGITDFDSLHERMTGAGFDFSYADAFARYYTARGGDVIAYFGNFQNGDRYCVVTANRLTEEAATLLAFDTVRTSNAIVKEPVEVDAPTIGSAWYLRDVRGEYLIGVLETTRYATSWRGAGIVAIEPRQPGGFTDPS
ncbi:hypothetical protein [Pontivivens ytuae]|uniref:Uncharacterized protein n=1 Tax=Pontivivens ytuae TaxID=2789856 RepID=A0A7S9QDE9_9RHOB|nr:hypothetical protein [Pontivivens ytuae]QPH55218.1 hypothetical protein I0K15_05615 [Pontivivens ytuae]